MHDKYSAEGKAIEEKKEYWRINEVCKAATVGGASHVCHVCDKLSI